MNKQKYPVHAGNGNARAFEMTDIKIEIDGMKVVMEKKAALLPVTVIEKKNENRKHL